MDLQELIEQGGISIKKGIDIAKNILNTKGSAGNNNQELSRILSAYELFLFGMNWLNEENEEMLNLPKIITQYQASIDGGYHNDYKAVLIAEEIARRQQNRKGTSVSIMNE